MLCPSQSPPKTLTIRNANTAASSHPSPHFPPPLAKLPFSTRPAPSSRTHLPLLTRQAAPSTPSTPSNQRTYSQFATRMLLQARSAARRLGWAGGKRFVEARAKAMRGGWAGSAAGGREGGCARRGRGGCCEWVGRHM